MNAFSVSIVFHKTFYGKQGCFPPTKRSLMEVLSNQLNFYCTFIYAANKGRDIKELWKELNLNKRIIRSSKWVIMGDVNVSLNIEDHSKDLVMEKWGLEVQGHHMYEVVKILKALKPHLNKLNWKNGNLFEKVTILKTKLHYVQRRIDMDLTNKDLKIKGVELLREYKEVAMDEEKLLRQKKYLKMKRALFDIDDDKAPVLPPNSLRKLGILLKKSFVQLSKSFSRQENYWDIDKAPVLPPNSFRGRRHPHRRCRIVVLGTNGVGIRSYSSDLQIYFCDEFPDNTTSKDMWEVCQGYGTVVDVYIPNRKSKAGKRFAFVCFIKVENVDRLVENLCTLWIGRIHLHANVVRFEHSPIHSSRPTNPIRFDNTGAHSFASALKGNPNISLPISSSPAMVLDDSCVVKRDLDNYVMGEVKQFSSINNLRVLLSNEGFQNVKLAYLGGLDVAEVMYCSDDESVKGADENNVETSKQVNLDAESDVEGEVNSGLDTSFPYSSEFTPENDNLNIDVHEVKGTDQAKSQSRSEGLCSRILEETQSLDEHLSFEIRVNRHEQKKGGSILEVLDDMIKVGQTMGFSMEGCMKYMENFIGSQGDHDVFQ
nr:RNA-directed DNA polymerase, eukaryota, nucleotide-binding alpha-beta plait domain protein [Tanacetum cinerariifolium]